MSTSHIKMSYEYGEKTPPNFYTDRDWVREHEQELLEQYGECSILVYQEQVVGVGDTYQAAITDAERRISPDAGIITPLYGSIVANRFIVSFPEILNFRLIVRVWIVDTNYT